MKELIEKNPLYENISKLFEVISYFSTQNYKELVGKIKSEMEYKMLDNNIIDGDSLFGLL